MGGTGFYGITRVGQPKLARLIETKIDRVTAMLGGGLKAGTKT